MPFSETVFLVGQRITPLVSPWSTTTNRESKLEEGGRSVIRSQEICWKDWEAKDLIDVRGDTVGYVLDLFCLQVAHLSTHFCTYIRY